MARRSKRAFSGGDLTRVNPIQVFSIESDSKPGTYHKVQFTGDDTPQPWWCDCMSWVMNVEHRGESVPRECKHTRRAAQLSKAGKIKPKVIKPLGPWFDQMQDYIQRLVTFAGGKGGRPSVEAIVGFRRDLERFEGEMDSLQDAVSTADTMLGLYRKLLKQASEQV